MAKVSVIGTGFVGAASAYATALTGACSDLMLVDMNMEKARAEAADISHAAAVLSGVRVHSGDYDQIAGSAVVVVAAGVNQKPGESRLNLLTRNASIFQSVIPNVVKYAPDAVIVVATNPVDIMTEVTRIIHPRPELVLGTGTVLDTARYRDLLGRETGVSPRYIHANVIGEHGDSSVLCWDNAVAAELPIAEYMKTIGKTLTQEIKDNIEAKVRGAAGLIINGKGATYYGIGAAVARIVSAILGDSRAIMTLSVPSKYGVCLALPSVIGAGGIQHIIHPVLSETEQAKLDKSASILLETQSAIIKDGKLL